MIAHLPTCTFPLTINVAEQCNVEWSSLQPHLHPTQSAVGHAWVYHFLSKSFGSKKDAQETMDDKILPVVKGPDGLVFLIDHHHTLAALDFSGFVSVKATVFLSCDLSHLTVEQAWTELVSKDFGYPYGRPAGQPSALPHALDFSSLPSRLVFRPGGNTTLPDDRWRSLGSFARKVKGIVDCPHGAGKYCMRAYSRVCAPSGQSIPFFEFRWAYFMNDAYLRPTLWENATANASFRAKFAALANTSDLDSYAAAAVDIVYLARSATAAAYSLPVSMGAMAGALPGVASGLDPIDSPDPDCSMARCLLSST
jgi:hypothetical protein